MGASEWDQPHVTQGLWVMGPENSSEKSVGSEALDLKSFLPSEVAINSKWSKSASWHRGHHNGGSVFSVSRGWWLLRVDAMNCLHLLLPGCRHPSQFLPAFSALRCLPGAKFNELQGRGSCVSCKEDVRSTEPDVLKEKYAVKMGLVGPAGCDLGGISWLLGCMLWKHR